MVCQDQIDATTGVGDVGVIFRYGPKVLLAAAGVITTDGISKRAKAKRLSDEASAAYEQAVEVAEKDVEQTNREAAAYGREQLQVKVEVVGRFADFLERNATEVARSNIDLLEGFDVKLGRVAEYRQLSVEAGDLLDAATKSVSAAVLAYRGAVSTAMRVGVAGTGTPIAALNGAAAQKATLAYLGGGSLAAGGGGMAAGRAVLQGLGLGSAAAVAAFSFHTHAEKTLTGAEWYHAEVEQYVARLGQFQAQLAAIRGRTGELNHVLRSLAVRATALLDQLEAGPIDPQRDRELLEQTLLVVKGVVEVARTPLLTEDGDLNEDTGMIVTRYRTKELDGDVAPS